MGIDFMTFEPQFASHYENYNAQTHIKTRNWTVEHSQTFVFNTVYFRSFVEYIPLKRQSWCLTSASLKTSVIY